jgi:transposase
MIVARPPSRLKVYRAVHFLYELCHEFGGGDSNPISFERWYGAHVRKKSRDAARRQWERLKVIFDAIQAPVRRVKEGRDVYLVLEPGARDFAIAKLNGLSKYVHGKGEVTMIDGSRFVLVDLDDIVPPKDREPERDRVEAMKESIRLCPIGVINPPIAVGEVAPFQLALGLVRYTACRELGLKKMWLHIVKTWDPIIAIDEEYVRKHYGAAELENLRQERDRQIAALKAAGKSNRQVAKELRIGATTVRRRSGAPGGAPEQAAEEARPAVVTGSDGKVYPSGRLKKAQLEERRETVKKLHAEGKSKEEIAEKVGVSESTVYADIKWTPCLRPDAQWFEVNARTEPPYVCLAALETGLAQLTDAARAGAVTLKQAKQVEHMFLAVAERIRRHAFDYRPPATYRSEAS